jgi:putative alpha-1,2-mannosidase
LYFFSIVPQSISTFIGLVGGEDAFIKRLDFFHTSGLADISNEPVFLTVYLYHYAGRPGLSAKRIHTYVPKSFNATNGGLPGNDDSGAMGSFVFFSMLGLFPVAGQNVYLISPPFFQQMSIKSPQTGKRATVQTVGFDAGYHNIYIQNATVNGKPWTKSWITHEFFTEGWTLELTLGDKESSWGTKAEDRPPSWHSASMTA